MSSRRGAAAGPEKRARDGTAVAAWDLRSRSCGSVPGTAPPFASPRRGCSCPPSASHALPKDSWGKGCRRHPLAGAWVFDRRLAASQFRRCRLTRPSPRPTRRGGRWGRSRRRLAI